LHLVGILFPHITDNLDLRFVYCRYYFGSIQHKISLYISAWCRLQFHPDSAWKR